MKMRRRLCGVLEAGARGGEGQGRELRGGRAEGESCMTRGWYIPEVSADRNNKGS